MFLFFLKKFEIKTMKGYHDLSLKCSILLLALMCFKNLEIIAHRVMVNVQVII